MKIKIKLNDGTVKYSSNVTKRKFSGILSKLESQNADIAGEASVEYSKGYSNEFTFSSADELKNKISPCLEPALIAEFSGL